MDNTFNVNLRRIRKEKNITQEQLADAVGVSAQAVSKWEMTGFPDSQLLPSIADYLGVSIDELFGRGENTEVNIFEKLMRYLDGLHSEEEKFHDVFELTRPLFISLCGGEHYFPLDERTLNAVTWENFSEVSWKCGYMQSRLNKNFQYFLFMPEPECGYDSLLSYNKNNENMVKLFRFMSDPDALRAMYYLAGRRSSMFFNVGALAHELHIKTEKSEKIIAGMLELKFIWEADFNGGSSNEKIYQYIAGCNFVSFLTFARTLINRPCCYNYQTNNREKPYFKNDTYKSEGEKK